MAEMEISSDLRFDFEDLTTNNRGIACYYDLLLQTFCVLPLLDLIALYPTAS